MTPEMQLSVVFDMACIRMWGPGAGKQVALALTVSESLVSRWRKPEHRELPSSVQLVALGFDFLVAYQKAQAHFYGFNKRALQELFDAFGDYARVVGA